MAGKAKPAPLRGRSLASERVLAAERDGQKSIPTTDGKQVSAEIYCGRCFLRTVRATAAGEFVAVVEEHKLGSFANVAEATDAVIAAHQPGWRA